MRSDLAQTTHSSLNAGETLRDHFSPSEMIYHLGSAWDTRQWLKKSFFVMTEVVLSETSR